MRNMIIEDNVRKLPVKRKQRADPRIIRVYKDVIGGQEVTVKVYAPVEYIEEYQDTDNEIFASFEDVDVAMEELFDVYETESEDDPSVS